MLDENAAQEQEQDQSLTSAETKKTEEHMIPKARLDEEIQKRRDLEKRLDAMEKASREAEERRLKEANDYKSLYEKTVAEYEEIKPRAQQVDNYQATIEEMLVAELATIPEDRRTLIPDELSADAKLRYISRNRALLSKIAPSSVAAGIRGGLESKSVELTPEEHQMAVDYGMSDEEYAKYKNK